MIPPSTTRVHTQLKTVPKKPNVSFEHDIMRKISEIGKVNLQIKDYWHLIML